jgi:hypothetical protein
MKLGVAETPLRVYFCELSGGETYNIASSFYYQRVVLNVLSGRVRVVGHIEGVGTPPQVCEAGVHHLSPAYSYSFTAVDGDATFCLRLEVAPPATPQEFLLRKLRAQGERRIGDFQDGSSMTVAVPPEWLPAFQSRSSSVIAPLSEIESFKLLVDALGLGGYNVTFIASDDFVVPAEPDSADIQNLLAKLTKGRCSAFPVNSYLVITTKGATLLNEKLALIQELYAMFLTLSFFLSELGVADIQLATVKEVI